MKLYQVATLVLSAGVLALGIVAVRAADEKACPVSGKAVAMNDKTVTLTVNGQVQAFCCAGCPAAFVKEPAKFVKTEVTCPVMKGAKVNMATAPRVAVNDNLFMTCCGACPDQITKNPAKFIKELKDPVSGQKFALTSNAPHSMYKGVHYLFANEANKKTFDTEPEKYSNKMLSKAS